MITFTPKKFIDALELKGIVFNDLIKKGISRRYFISRNKEGTKRLKFLSYDYKKRIHEKNIEKIATTLIYLGYYDKEEEKMIKQCFYNDDFNGLLPRDLL